jgi:AcrR family transcriptional regulator
MARTSDPLLSERILEAAWELWEKGGDAGFNLRDLAQLAGTTTPTLYTRYSSRDELLRALRDQQAAEMQEALRSTTSFSALCKAYLAEANANPRRYELVFGPNWLQRTTATDIELFLGSLVDRVRRETGYGDAQARRAAFQVWLLLHGAAMQRIGESAEGGMWKSVVGLCLDACDRLIESFRGSEPR